jgi:hypothetical protein
MNTQTIEEEKVFDVRSFPVGQIITVNGEEKELVACPKCGKASLVFPDGTIHHCFLGKGTLP